MRSLVFDLFEKIIVACVALDTPNHEGCFPSILPEAGVLTSTNDPHALDMP